MGRKANPGSKSRIYWTEDEHVFSLIAKYQFYKNQGEFDSALNTHTTVWDKIAIELESDSFHPTGRACSDKWRAIVKRYKGITASFTSGAGFDLEKIQKTFPFYTVLDEALRDRPQINPDIVNCSQNLSVDGDVDRDESTPEPSTNDPGNLDKSGLEDESIDVVSSGTVSCDGEGSDERANASEETNSTDSVSQAEDRKSDVPCTQPPAGPSKGSTKAKGKEKSKTNTYRRKFDILHRQHEELSKTFASQIEHTRDFQSKVIKELSSSNKTFELLAMAILGQTQNPTQQRHQGQAYTRPAPYPCPIPSISRL